MTTDEFILRHREEEPAKVALLAEREKSIDRIYAIQQIEGWQKARTKLPEISDIEGWTYPPRLSMEQCSSELTAKYKHEVINSSTAAHKHFEGALTAEGNIDLTGGFGIDAYYMGATDYVEQSEELCRIAERNFALAGRSTRVHNTTAEAYLHTLTHANLIYIDPARRDSHGGKVFRLQDCTPNVVELYPTLIAKCDRLLLKLSPMLDITEALRHLPDAREVHIVAVRNEVKEVLILCEKRTCQSVRTLCVNLATPDPIFTLDNSSPAAHQHEVTNAPQELLYSPNAAIMKAGAYTEVATRFGLTQLAPNSHLYTADHVIPDFPGRIWQVHEATKEELKALTQANILCRNYPLRPEEIKKKYRLRDGGDTYLIGSRVGNKPILFLGIKIR